jgi:hypothetical protein
MKMQAMAHIRFMQQRLPFAGILQHNDDMSRHIPGNARFDVGHIRCHILRIFRRKYGKSLWLCYCLNSLTELLNSK